MIDLAAVINRAFLNFDKIADLYVVGELGPGPEPGKGSYLTFFASARALNVTI